MTPFFTLLLAAAIQPALPEAPNRQPQLTVANGVVGLTFGAGKAIYYASSSDNGRTFGAPVKVAEVGALALGRHRGPRLTVLKDSLLITAIVAEKVATGPHAHGLPENGNLTLWRSTNRGRTWSRTVVINDVPGAAREGLHAIAPAPDGALFAVWLDLRTPGMKLYGSRSRDGGQSWSKNVEVYASPEGTICNCCHPSIAVEPSGTIWVMWRNVLEGNRDLYVARSVNGGPFQAVTKQGAGTWKINACPMDGGGFVVEDGKVASAWRRESDIYLAESGKPERRLGPGKDVALTRTRRGIFTAWTNKEGAIVLQAPGAAEPQLLGANGGFVNLAPLPGGGVLAAWESQGTIQTKVVD